MRVSVVVSPAHHLLAGGPEQDGVLELSGVAALGVAEGRVGVDDTQVAQVLQGHQVLALAETVQPAAAERQRAEVLVDHIQQVLRSGQSGEDQRFQQVNNQVNNVPTLNRRSSGFLTCTRMRDDKLLPDGDVADVKVLHVVRALHVVVDHAFPCAAKRLDGVNLSFLRRQSTQRT